MEIILDRKYDINEKFQNMFDIQNIYDNVYLMLDNKFPGGNLNYLLAEEIVDYYENTGLIKENTVLISNEEIDFSIALANVCSKKGIKLYVVTEKPAIEDLLTLKLLNCETIIDNKHNNDKKFFEKYFNSKINILHIDLEDFKELINNIIRKMLLDNYQILKSKNIKAIIIKDEPNIITRTLIKELKNLTYDIIGVYVVDTQTNYENSLRTRKNYDDFYIMDKKEAYETMISLVKEKNIYIGIKGAAAIRVALMRNLEEEKNILAIAPDRMERYFSLVQYYQI